MVGYGKIKRSNGKIFKRYVKGGYYSTKIRNVISGKYFCRRVHRLVAACFLGIPNPDHIVNHKDGNKLNNTVSNLEYLTRSENIKHAIRTGLIDFSTRKFRKTAVRQKDQNGKELNTFNSIRSAMNATGVCETSIVAVCKQRQYTAGGYIWEYI